MPYEFKTPPFGHQGTEFTECRKLPARALFWEQGTGKSKEIIDQAGSLYEEGEINGLFLLAPNGVHRNWVVEEIPTHLPDRTMARTRMHWYSGRRHATIEHRRQVRGVTDAHPELFSVLAMSYDSMMTEHGRAAAKEFLMTRRCMYTLDEARRIKDPSAKRTKRVLNSAPYARYRRILNGTPIANGPFDVYSQVKFLDDKYWEKQGISTYAGFKTTFAEFKPITLAGGKTITVVDSYKNLPLLQKMLAGIASRVTKEDVLDLPPKLFTTRSFEMTKEQERVYTELEREFMVFLQSGEVVTAELALTRLLRLQQATCGYLPSDGGGMVDICPDNPRLDLLGEICEDLPHKAIIWSRFKRDTDKICALLGDLAVRYDGTVDEDGRAVAIERFQKPGGDAQSFVANAQAAGEGLTLHAAKTVVYYSNSFNLAERLQSEDRAHRIGQTQPVNYIDFIASGTVDEKIAKSLQEKLDIASQITGDRARTWLA